MNKTLQILQLNVHKQKETHQSVMNDETLKDFAVLAIQEPYARNIDNSLVTAPNGHHNWRKLMPTETRDGTWPIRSLLWIRKDIEAEQIPIPSPDLTAASLRLPDRKVLVASVYIEGESTVALAVAMEELGKAIKAFRDGTGSRTDVILLGDFNRHDYLWGGDDVLPHRQGEADKIVELMDEYSLRSLLPRGTKTWSIGGLESTIDLVLASAELAEQLTKCRIHPCDHGSDHRAIETAFDIAIRDRPVQIRLLFKNAPWTAIRTRIAANLESAPQEGNVQEQTDQLMSAVQEAIHKLTPKAKPSPYAKKWWTTDLTRLRRIYTYWRNQARAQRRIGQANEELEKRAKQASKEYHDAIRKQKKTHWEDFLSDDANIWQATKYLRPSSSILDNNIPPLTRRDGSTTEDESAQAKELLTTFFPLLPTSIEDECPCTNRTPIDMPELTLEEIEEKVFAAKPWKAPGEDGLPSAVWKQVWPVVKERVTKLFKTSIHEGRLPSQWKAAKIIPLRKPGKSDYTLAKAWRPISLLSTLGKILEAVIAERISYAAETWGLLPANHFGARKQRSAEQALMLLQEHIYHAWRNKRVVSLISFDVKGAYNGVFKDRLLQRLGARGIPQQLVRWIDSFCSERTASITVNGYTSDPQLLLQAGLPQGSPLSPILFLFFNADLVQHKIYSRGGAIAFVDDYTAWVTGPTADANRAGIQAIIDRALNWERRSGATFEGEKTCITHFTRIAERSNDAPFTIKGETIRPKTSAKILGVVMDCELRYKQHIARAASKGLDAALALGRLKMLSPRTTRQLFASTVVPAVDYASNVWRHACGVKASAALNRVQKIGAQAITGAFRTVATAVAEAEAAIQTVRGRHDEKAIKMWIYIRTLPPTHPLTSFGVPNQQRYASPLQKLVATIGETSTEWLEKVLAYTIAPWSERLQLQGNADTEGADERANEVEGILAATSSSGKNDLVGMGACVQHEPNSMNTTITRYSTTLGTKDRQNPYTAELVAIATVLKGIPSELQNQQITIFSRNKGALAAITQPRHQSGQNIIRQIYDSVQHLKRNGNKITLRWVPSQEDFVLGTEAKSEAQEATKQGQTPSNPMWLARSTITRLAVTRQRQGQQLPAEIGYYSKTIDTALPGRHTRGLYDKCKRNEANILAQLRTGMARLNSYLHKIRAAETDMCECGQARETVQHFLFHCTRWKDLRHGMLECTTTRREDLSFFLGGRSASDQEPWQPDMNAVRATIKFAIATGRLERD
jgi:Reverse transcriptase (RNA-dependent DNA polymerase)/Endonuclease-reverse transcriptase